MGFLWNTALDGLIEPNEDAMKNTVKTAVTLACAALALTACDGFMRKEKEAPKFGSLKHQLLLVDEAGTRYGSVEMDPVTGGRLFDAEGKLIGTIVTPAVTSTVTTVSPVTPGY